LIRFAEKGLSTMTPVKNAQSTGLSRDVIQAFDDLNGLHPGFRPAHAKGILLSGVFTPSPGGSSLTRAAHLQRSSTPVTVRFSDFAGIPTIPDNNPEASPRGIGIRFHLAEHVHTDITAHSVDGFPARTAEEFVEFLRAIHASGPTAPKPSPIESFLATHPAALEFIQAPKPIPSSFAKETFYAVSAYKFTNQSGVSRFGRYRIRPDGGGEYLDPEAAAGKSANFLMDEIKERLAKGPTKLHIDVQLAETGDIVDNSTVHWPEDRPRIEFGTLELTGLIPNNDAEQNHIIYDPIPRVDGIDPSGDPLLEPRADTYLMSGRRRRASGAKVL
jgi:catalase